MKKAIIFDLDGTAVDSPGKKLPTEELIRTISKLKDMFYFCAATGRVWSFAKPVLQALKLTDPCIISAGTQICDPQTGSILWERTIDQEGLEKAIAVFKKNPTHKLLYNDSSEDDYFHGGIFPVEFKNHEPVYFLEQVFVPDKIALELNKELSVIKHISCVMVVSQRPGCRDLHVIDSAATKEHAISILINMLRIEKKNTIGIGDGYNDIHLFNGVGYKVAMGNAVPELKQKADKIIGPVKNDGLEEYLDSLHTA